MATSFDDQTVREARRWIDHVAEDGAICPCCRQVVKTYPRTINATMSLVLIEMARAVSIPSGPVWLHVGREVIPRLVARGVAGATSGDYAKLRYWDLIAPMPIGRALAEQRPASGVWRVTARGLMFVRRRVMVQRVALVRDGEVVGFRGEQVDIAACLGERFDYGALVAGSRWLDPTQPQQGILL